jgi:hypothetical protein
MRRAFVVLLALTVAGTAHAGGLGILGTGGVRTQATYYYDNTATPKQYQLTQMIGGGGFGIEGILGDRDDRIVGLFRGYWLREAPETNPADMKTTIPSDQVVAAVRTDPRDVGIAMVGVDWAAIGKPTGLAFNAIGLVGSGFITTDHTEFFQLEVGPGMSWEFAHNLRLAANLSYQLRYRKSFQHGVSAYAGLRYMFD